MNYALKMILLKKRLEDRIKEISENKKDLVLYRIIDQIQYVTYSFSTGIKMEVSLIVYGRAPLSFTICAEPNDNRVYGLYELDVALSNIELLDPFEFTGKAKEVHLQLKELFEGIYRPEGWNEHISESGGSKSIKKLIEERDKLQKEEDKKGKENTMTENNLKTVYYHGIELKIKEEKIEEYNTLTKEIDTMFKMEYAKSEEAKSEIVRYFTRYFRLNPFRRSDLSQDEKDNYHLDSLHELARMLEVHDIKFYTNGISESLYKFGMYHAKSYNNGVIEKAISTISHETPEGMFFRFDYDKLGETVLYGYEEDRKLRDMYDYIRRVEDDYDTIIVVLNRMRGLFDYAFKADAKSRSKKSVVNNAYGADPITTLGTKLI